MSNRRTFLIANLACFASLATTNLFSTPIKRSTKMDIDPINPELVKEFVAQAHGGFDRVKELLAQQPNLLNAAHDWGGGDFETALGAAAHVGRNDIAAYLILKGARMDIFCATMLGKFDLVKSTLDAFPNLKTSKGPHGLTLLHHARQGGESAKPVLEYLLGIGAD